MLASPVSWAKVGRETVAALAAAGAHVSAVSLKGFLYDGAFALSEEVRAAVAGRRLPGCDLALDYPPNFARLDGKRRAGILIYEADRFPEHWAKAVRAHLDLAFVPSAFCLEAAVAAGIDREMLETVPFGVNHSIYSKEGSRVPPATGKTFNFLTVGAPHVRKGLAETVKAFVRAFEPDEDVGLVIKCPPIDALGKRPWEYGGVEEFLGKHGDTRISLVEGSLDEREMAALYRGTDAYVQASYGEGFGLAALEAAACGLPVVTTNWGAATEMFDASSALTVDFDLVDASKIAYDWPPDGGKVHMAKPRMEHLAVLMRKIYEDAALRSTLAANGLRVARRMTWARTAAGILEALAKGD